MAHAHQGQQGFGNQIGSALRLTLMKTDCSFDIPTSSRCSTLYSGSQACNHWAAPVCKCLLISPLAARWLCVTCKCKFSSKCWLECSAETIGTNMACIVVAISENCDLIFGPSRCTGLRGNARPRAGRTCQLQFDTIELGNIIVCGLPASPHNSVHVSDARRRLLRVPRDAANQCMAAHDPACHRLHVCPKWLSLLGSGLNVRCVCHDCGRFELPNFLVLCARWNTLADLGLRGPEQVARLTRGCPRTQHVSLMSTSFNWPSAASGRETPSSCVGPGLPEFEPAACVNAEACDWSSYKSFLNVTVDDSEPGGGNKQWLSAVALKWTRGRGQGDLAWQAREHDTVEETKSGWRVSH